MAVLGAGLHINAESQLRLSGNYVEDIKGLLLKLVGRSIITNLLTEKNFNAIST
jgi:hypothetical protein